VSDDKEAAPAKRGLFGPKLTRLAPWERNAATVLGALVALHGLLALLGVDDNQKEHSTTTWFLASIVAGVWPATVTALEVIDGCLARIVDAIEEVDARAPEGRGAALLVTADHGNADELRDAHGNPVTAHSLNPVPIVGVGPAFAGRALHDGVLADVAPTILELAGLEPWSDITGRSLLAPAPVLPSGAASREVPRS
jgi:hypothetical protein